MSLPSEKFIAIAKSFFPLIIFIVGGQRAVPSDHRRARQAVPLQNEITSGNRSKRHIRKLLTLPHLMAAYLPKEPE
jgi:hypothetical protein